ncbi:MAG: ABC transporter ATP-binding protein [Deltaproteobacteria bacterium]|nr:ABC transporter ATP-binding protein [Deltaproteobacteria bacterium]
MEIEYSLEIKSVTKRYRDFIAVDNISLRIRSGLIFGFLGPNGAGKTTTIKMIGGLLKPTSGDISICGHSITADPIRAKSLLGFVPDRPYLYEKLTGTEYLKFIGGIYNLTDTEVSRRSEELLGLFEIYNFRNELIENYSHGMKQRLVICGALIHRPRLFVIDEPLVGLDPKGARLLKRVFTELAIKSGSTVFMSTHTLGVVEELCDELAIIHHGQLIYSGDIDGMKKLSGKSDANLEELFLQLTGGDEQVPLDNII